ncbi:hypothetical protein STW0522ENT51_32980 [Enterobacter kobei]|nr:hypothetical protein STW0522ENT51_32980 [Enterobacter kobei]
MVPVALRPPFNILCVIEWSKSFQSIDKKQFYIFLFLLYCLYVGLPRSWWEGSERHIQLSVVEHHPQFKALPVSVSPGFYPQQPDLAVKCLRISV